MQLGHAHLKNIEGLVFYKLLGSGAENGFSSNQTLVLMHYYLGIRNRCKYFLKKFIF
jgi:hypothetical protein